MKRLILDFLRRRWLGILFISVVAVSSNWLQPAESPGEKPGFVFFSCLLAPLLGLAVAFPSLMEVRQERVLHVLPLARGETAKSLWIVGLLTGPLVGIATALPFYLADLVHSWWFGQVPHASATDLFLFSLIGLSLSGWGLLWVSLMPGPHWPELRSVRWSLLMVLWQWGVPAVLFFVFVAPFFAASVLPKTLGFRNVLPCLPGLVALAVSLPLIRRLQVGFPPRGMQEEEAAHPIPALGEKQGIIFENMSHPFQPFFAQAVFQVLYMAAIVLVILVGVAVFGDRAPGTPLRIHFPIEKDAKPGDALFLLICMCLMLVSTLPQFHVPVLRVARTLPLRARGISILTAAYISVLLILPALAAAPLLWLYGDRGNWGQLLLRYLLIADGLILMLYALTLDFDLLRCAVLLAALVGGTWLAVLTPVLVPLRNPVISNTLGLILIGTAYAWLHNAITHSSRPYRLKPGKG